MKGSRVFWFLVCIVLGAAAGLFYGWVINPIRQADASPGRLREDYQSDYVLMVAEVYAHDEDISAAMDRLEFLGNEPVIRYVQEAILTAQELGYSRQDVDILAALNDGIQSWIPSAGGGS